MRIGLVVAHICALIAHIVYAAVRQSLGEPDPFRLKHRDALREIVRTIVLERLDKKTAFFRIAAWARKNVEADETGPIQGSC